MSVVDVSFDHPLKIEEKAAMPLAGGMMNHGHQCGMLWGAALAAGAQASHLFGANSTAEARAVVAAQKLVGSFRSRYQAIDCFDITEVELKFTSKTRLLKQISKFFIKKGGPIGCFRMAASYGPAAFDEIDTALSNGQVDSPSGPVSCAAVLARKMGVSDRHAVMAAGLAGGIGLSGGSCGALGAAIWIIAMQFQEADEEINLWTSESFQSKAADVIDRFLQSTDFEFQCVDVTGRKFESVEDHASYLRDGGCMEIIEALAADE